MENRAVPKIRVGSIWPERGFFIKKRKNVLVFIKQKPYFFIYILPFVPGSYPRLRAPREGAVDPISLFWWKNESCSTHVRLMFDSSNHWRKTLKLSFGLENRNQIGFWWFFGGWWRESETNTPRNVTRWGFLRDFGGGSWNLGSCRNRPFFFWWPKRDLSFSILIPKE